MLPFLIISYRLIKKKLYSFCKEFCKMSWKKNNTWNTRHLVNESFVPANKQTSVLYCRMSDSYWVLALLGENLSRLFSEHLDFFSMKCIWNSSIQLQFRNHWTSRLERYIICKTRNSYIIHMKAIETVILWLWQAVKHFWEERQIWKTTF